MRAVRAFAVGATGWPERFYAPELGGYPRPRAEPVLADLGRRRWDPVGLDGWMRGRPVAGRSCFDGVAVVRAGHGYTRDLEIVPGVPPEPPEEGLLAVLEGALERILALSLPIALALSGGLDSALVLALLLRMGRTLPVYTLVCDAAGYGEEAETLRTARALGVEPRIVRTSLDELRGFLPGSIAACERPLYNLHPVARTALAMCMRADGFDVMLTGDGADQVCAGEGAGDYLPIVDALCGAGGMELRSPFLDPLVDAKLRSFGPQPDKRALREAAAELLPAELLARRKTPRYAPEICVARYFDPATAASIARCIGREPALDSDRERVAWASACLLARSHHVEEG